MQRPRGFQFERELKKLKSKPNENKGESGPKQKKRETLYIKRVKSLCFQTTTIIVFVVVNNHF